MQLSEFASLVLIAVLPGLVETVVCLPVLLSTRVQALFRSLPPTESMSFSYVGVIFSLSVPFILGVIAAFRFDTLRTPVYDVLTQVASLVSLGYIAVLPVAATFGLPRYGIDWDPTGYGIKTWGVMLLSTLWYVTWLILPLLLISALLALPTG
jgi:hypothetical protein